MFGFFSKVAAYGTIAGLNMGSDVKGPNVHKIIYVTASDLHVINSKGVTAKREALLQGEVLTEVPLVLFNP